MKPFISGLTTNFSYPDSCAFKARFYYEVMPVMGPCVLIYEIDFMPSAYLNFSCHISTDSGKTAVMSSVLNSVLELGNPFIFPNRNTYVIGNGSVLNLVTIVIRISEGSFGQCFYHKWDIRIECGNGKCTVCLAVNPDIL